MNVETGYTFSKSAARRAFGWLVEYHHIRRLVPIVGISLCLVALSFLVVPTLLGSWYYQAGLRALEQGSEAQQVQQLAVAIDLFEQSREWAPLNADRDYAIAQAYLQLDQPQQAIPLLEHAFRQRPDSLVFQRRLALSYQLVGQTEQARALLEHSGVSVTTLLSLGLDAMQVGDIEAMRSWYQQATLLVDEPFDTFDEPLSDQAFVLESFATAAQLRVCSWCLTAPDGHFTIEQGVVTMQYTNVQGRRDGFAILLLPQVNVERFDTLKLRVRGDPETLVALEFVLNRTRTRVINYQAAPTDWQVWSIPLSEGTVLEEVLLFIAETEPTATVERAHFEIDWIVLE